jgi:hypothetical protein
MTNVTDPAIQPVTVEQLFALEHLFGAATVKAKISFALAQKILGSKGASKKAIAAVLGALDIELVLDPYAEERDWCLEFLTKAGAPIKGLEDLIIQPRLSDTAWLHPFPEGFGCNAIYENDGLWAFPKWRVHDDIDAVLIGTDLSARWAWVEPNLPGMLPDALTLGQSANTVDPSQTSIRLRTGMMHYALAHAKVGRIPAGGTICGGSRFQHGNVPYLYLAHDGEASVSHCDPDYEDGAYGVRQKFWQRLTFSV